MRRTALVVAYTGAMILATTAYVAAQDVAGSADHPMITRYAGSRIIAYVQVDFDEYEAPLGRAAKTGGGSSGRPVFDKSQNLEGKITRILYKAPEGRSSMEVLRNYTTALSKQGFKTLFECSADACGNYFYWRGRFFSSGGVFISPPVVQRYLTARLARPEGDVYVGLFVGEMDHAAGIVKGTFMHLDVVEVKPMDTGLVTVNAAAMAKDISQSGHVALYGIFFDTGSAAITAASDAAITEIAALLRDNPKMRLHIVGHTDTEGTFEFNMDLSRRRAEAVVQTLVAKHMIAAARLRASGVGYLAPVASNRAEEGRAKNRRVELVEIF